MRKERMNDKGFSLVELIIVIAIMAILVVVLAPQYLRYVERARNSTDMQNARTIMTALETWAVDPQATSGFGPATPGAVSFSIVIRQQGDATGNTVTEPTGATPAAATPINDALVATGLDIDNIFCSSRTTWSDYTIQGTVEDNGAITWSFLPTEFDNVMHGIPNP